MRIASVLRARPRDPAVDVGGAVVPRAGRRLCSERSGRTAKSHHDMLLGTRVRKRTAALFSRVCDRHVQMRRLLELGRGKRGSAECRTHSF